MSINSKKNKYAAMITYVIALVCMVAALFIPVFDNGTMLFREIPGAFSALTGGSFSSGFFQPFGLASYYTAFNPHFNLAALAVIIYTIVTVLGLLAFIIIAALRKDSKAAIWITYIFEILTMLSLLLFAYDRLSTIASVGFSTVNRGGQVGWVLLAVLGVVWLMFTLQSAYYRGVAGLANSLLLLLSALSFLCLFACATAFSIDWMGDIADSLKISHYFVGDVAAFALICYAGWTFSTNATYAFAFITAIVVLINIVIDCIALAFGSNRLSKTINLVRYGLELFLAIVTAIVSALNNITPGIYLYTLMVLALLQIVISTARMFTRATIEESSDYEYDEGFDSVAPAPAAVPEKNEEKPADTGSYTAEPAPSVVYPYGFTYQDDKFLNSLTPSERAEFYAIFIDKRRGNFYFLPEYEIGGENTEFFRMLFIYLGEVMGIVSDGLMSKIYRRFNMIT